MINTPKKPKKLSMDMLVLNVLALFIFLFVGTIASVIGYAYYTEYSALTTLSMELTNFQSDEIAGEIKNFINPAEFTKIFSHFLEADIFKPNNRILLERSLIFMETALRSYSYLNSFYLVDNKGNYLQTLRILGPNFYYANEITKNKPPETAYISIISHQSSTTPLLTTQEWIYKDATGHTLETHNIDIPYSSASTLNRDWYIGAKTSPNRYWVGVVPLHYLINFLGFSIAYRVDSASEQFLGIAATNFRLSSLIDFLKLHKPSENGISYIVSNKDEIIPPPEKGVSTAVLRVDQVKDLRIAQAYRFFLNTRKEEFIFSNHHEKYIANFAHLTTTQDKTWWIGTLSPLNDFMGAARTQLNFMLIVSGLILILGIILIVIIARNISRPIAYLAEETEKVKRFELSDPIKLDTYIAEVQMMRDAIISMKAGLESFSKYVPFDLVNQLIQTGEVAKLGGTRRQIAIMFTDITGFTPIAEKLTPEELTATLSYYLQALAEIIKAHQGTVDKYIGDAVMAFWGAPMPDNDQIEHACRTALLCQEKIKSINEQWEAENKPTFVTRIGLHAGYTFVGNLGSPDRMNYTIIGDAVNLAARLEQLNKYYQTSIITSESIYEVAKTKFLFRPLGLVTVKGRHAENLVYELIAATVKEDANILATEAQTRLCLLTQQAFSAYQQQQWHEAQKGYQQISAEFPQDPISKIYLELLKQFKNNSPT